VAQLEQQLAEIEGAKSKRASGTHLDGGEKRVEQSVKEKLEGWRKTLAEREKTEKVKNGPLLLWHAFTPPLQPYQFRHLRLSLSGPVALSPPAPPPALPPCWLAPEALATIAAFSATEEARAVGLKELPAAAVAVAERDFAQLQVFLNSFARAEVSAGDAGLFGVVSAALAQPPALALRVRAGQAEPPPDGGAHSDDESAPFSPAIVAPVVCPNYACAAVLAVDVPAAHGADRGLHISCTTCGTGLCGHCACVC
jgi:hypothetical protein